MNREFSNPGEDAWECLQHAANMICRVHVRGIESGDHRIKTRLLFLRQRLVSHRDPRVSEGVVVKRSVRIQVIGRAAIGVNTIGPLLLQRYAKQRHPSGFVSHDLQEVVNVDAFLNVVSQVKVRIVEEVVIRLRRAGLCLRELN